MKNFSDLTHRLLFVLVIILFAGDINLIAQDQQYKARLSVDYQKLMGESETLLINGKFKGEDGYEPTIDLQLNVYYEVTEDSLILLGQASTDKKGNAVFRLASPTTKSDSIIKHTYVVKIENRENFEDDDKSVSFMESNLTAETIVKDSINYVSAKFTDAVGEPLEGQKMEVLVHRLFGPLTIGKSSYRTDNDGIILVPMEEPLPGVDGILTFEVVTDSRKYGIVKNVFESPIGQQVEDLSTFDKRTLWSPPGKTPLFLLIFPNLIILGIWALIILLFSNLYKIYNSKN